MEFDISAFLLGCILGGIVSWRACDLFHTSLTKDLLKAVGVGESQLKRAIETLQADVSATDESALPGVEVRVEQVGDQLYVYRLDTEEFLCQGATRDDIVNCLATRFHRDFKIIVSEEHGAKYLKESPSAYRVLVDSVSE
jgi:hypothetical protein